MIYKVTGLLTNGRRFKPIKTESYQYANGINLYNGSVWESNGTTWKRIKRVY